MLSSEQTNTLPQRGKLELSGRLKPRDLWAFRAAWDLD